MMEQTAASLGPEDFAVLNNLSIQSMDGKKQADALIAKMTADEKQAFYGWVNQQPHGNQDTRKDSAIASGVPLIGSVNPEDALVGGQIVRKGVQAGGSVIGRVLSTMKEAAPIIKYEAIKTGLHATGIPEPIAAVMAAAAAGYRGKGAAAEAEAAPAADAVRPPGGKSGSAGLSESPRDLTARLRAEHRAAAATSPVESASGGTAPPVDPPVSPAPAAAQTGAHPTRSAGQMSPTAIQSDLGLAARRAGLKLTEPQYQQAEALVRSGQEPAAAVQAVQAAPTASSDAVAQSPTGDASSTKTPSTAGAPKVTLTAAQFQAAAKEYQALRLKGLTDQQAREAIANALQMNASLGLKTPTVADTKFPKGMRGKVPPPQ